VVKVAMLEGCLVVVLVEGFVAVLMLEFVEVPVPVFDPKQEAID